MAFQGKFTCYSVGQGEDSAKGPVEGSTKGATQELLLSKSLIAGLSRHLKVVLPFLL